VSSGSIIVDRLEDLVGGRVYANTFPQEPDLPTWPAIRFTVISEIPFPDQCGSEDTATDDVHVQIDAVSESYDDLLALKALIIAAMALGDVPALRESGGFETFDSETKTHRTILEYTLQPSTITIVPLLDFSDADNSMYLVLLMDD
jgi:hypothetical protein